MAWQKTIAVSADGKMLEILIDEPDCGWRIIHASYCEAHSHAAGAKSGNQDMSRT